MQTFFPLFRLETHSTRRTLDINYSYFKTKRNFHINKIQHVLKKRICRCPIRFKIIIWPDKELLRSFFWLEMDGDWLVVRVEEGKILSAVNSIQGQFSQTQLYIYLNFSSSTHKHVDGRVGFLLHWWVYCSAGCWKLLGNHNGNSMIFLLYLSLEMFFNVPHSPILGIIIQSVR